MMPDTVGLLSENTTSLAHAQVNIGKMYTCGM